MSWDHLFTRSLARWTLALLATLAPAAFAAQSFNPGPNAIDIPAWFQDSFLDFRDDVRDAARQGKRLMVYFGQDGCPYCRELMRVNFSQKDIVDKTRARFVAVAVNLWGDREVVWTDGKSLTEKTLAARLGVQFTPTLLFLDEKGRVALRVNGYYPPHEFHAALDYAANRNEQKTTFPEYLKRHARAPASGVLHDEPFFLKAPLDLDRSRKAGARPLAVLFEQKQCAACDELHGEGFRNSVVRPLTGRLDFARLDLFGSAALVTPSGKSLTAADWGRQLKVAYTPTIVFFDATGREVFRIEAYLKPFHLASALDYVASGAYLEQPSFQRYIQSRAARIRSEGGRVDLW